jgi:hypothetical protein
VPLSYAKIAMVFLGALKENLLQLTQTAEANLFMDLRATVPLILGHNLKLCVNVLPFSVFIRNRAQYFSVTFWCSRAHEHSSVTRDNQQQKE